MRRLARALLGLAVGSWLLAGCGVLGIPAAAPKTPSALALTTETPIAAPESRTTAGPAALTPLLVTETPFADKAAPAAATATPTPANPSATPNANLMRALTPTEPPTPDANLGVGPAVYEDEFDGENGWAWPYAEDDIAAFSLGGNRLNAVMKVGNAGGPRIVAGKPTLQIGDQQWQVTSLTNLCYAKDEYGVLFRGNAAATDGYLFKLSCEGKARVEALQNLRPTVLADWTASPAILPGAPAENTLLVWASHDQLRFFVNGKHLFSIADKTFAQGTYGFYILDRTSGGESVSFDHLVVKAVSLP